MKSQFDEAFQLRKNQDYQSAINIYSVLWLQDPNLFNDWAGWSYAYCLIKLNRYIDALQICRTLYPRFKNSEIISTIYGQSVYQTQFNIANPPSIEILRKALKAMFQLSPPHHPYSFTPKATFKFIKTLLSQQQIKWDEINEWLLKIDPDLLDDRPYKWTNSKGKTIDLASSKEEWYSHMIRAKAGLNKPQELLDYLATARKLQIKWHYNNDIWFARKEAFAHLQLGDKKTAEQILRKICFQRKDWFLLFDLSLVTDSQNEKQKLMCRAALLTGKIEHKVKLFHALYDDLKNSDPKIAILHLELVASIRKENNWPIPIEVENELNENEITLNSVKP